MHALMFLEWQGLSQLLIPVLVIPVRTALMIISHQEFSYGNFPTEFGPYQNESGQNFPINWYLGKSGLIASSSSLISGLSKFNNWHWVGEGKAILSGSFLLCGDSGWGYCCKKSHSDLSPPMQPQLLLSWMHSRGWNSDPCMMAG